jgi:uncharacterized protein
MKIARDITASLERWKNSAQRKPLILQGTRQTGKTWVMREFGRRFYENVAEFNFDKTTELTGIFKKTKDVKRIINELALFTNVPIVPGKTLIIFDEIQECSEAFNSLKYFCEDAPEYHIVSAGSLLGVALRKKKMPAPVGKVDILFMRPVSFREFLRHTDQKIFSFTENISEIQPLPEIVYNRLQEEYKRYLLCGGMPEALVTLLESRGMDNVEAVLQNIIYLYTLDFAKYSGGVEIARINNLWNSLPSQLAKENKKFIYKVVKNGARAREYEDALLWLEEAGLVFRVFNLTKPGIPMSAYRDVSAFKLYAFDCGILRRLARLSPEIMLTGHTGYTEFKGAIAENAVLQALVSQFDEMPHYWTSGNSAEVDFILQTNKGIVPAEVKSELRVSGKSLSVFHSKFAPALRIRFSMNNLRQDQGFINIPVFMADWTSRLIDLAT